MRLVSQSNPATREYQPANNGYPPSGTAGPYTDRSPQQLMDPFFDDEEDNVPDSAFGRPAPMRSQESGLPLTRSAAPPAGVGSSTTLPQDWTFDDEFQSSNQQSFSRTPKQQYSQKSSKFSGFNLRKRKWPWQKEKVLTGERVIALNNTVANVEFSSNFVSTSKYNLITFIPKFLFGVYFFNRFVTYQLLTVLKNNSPNTPMYSSYSRPSFSKYLVFLQLNHTRPSFH